MVQLSHPYMTPGKTIVLTIWALVSKVMSLLFNMLSRFVIAFLPREQASFNFMTAVTICSDFGAQENKTCHHFHCFPIYLPWSDGTRCHDILEINPEYSLEGLILTLKFQCFGHLMQVTDYLEKTLKLGKIEGKRWSRQQRMRWLVCFTDSIDMSLSKLWRRWMTEKSGMLQSMGWLRFGED